MLLCLSIEENLDCLLQRHPSKSIVFENDYENKTDFIPVVLSFLFLFSSLLQTLTANYYHHEDCEPLNL